jgi:hypothetical protein
MPSLQLLEERLRFHIYRAYSCALLFSPILEFRRGAFALIHLPTAICCHASALQIGRVHRNPLDRKPDPAQAHINEGGEIS